jgi:uncharacterized caspase-like protein
MGRNWAISIGINNYDFSQNLNYAKRDAELMRDFLTKEAGFEQVLFFSENSPDYAGKSTRPSFINLRSVLRTRFEKPFMEAGDNFWFFFSGHGMRHKGCDYLMACDSDPGDIEHTAISINYVTERLRRCGADNVVLILDACRSQGSKSGEGIGNQAAQVARQEGVITIFSCSPHEYSYEIDDLQQGIFTKALLDGLGVQGKCATVERLNHYLNGRVPDLIRQYKKGDTSRQTPYMIVEPATKYHLILCPQYATKADVAPMKFDASIAELHQDFDLAQQLWIRVLAASPGGDMDAVNGLQRIAVAKIQPAAIPDQPSCKNSAATNKSPQPAPPNPTPIESDVPLKSERGVDYTKLRDLLASGKWKEADEETREVILKAAGREKERWLNSLSIDNFPCEDLRTIDQLWVKYSNGRFGFSVQKRIYHSLGEIKKYDRSWDEFGDTVGWRVNGEWLSKDNIYNRKYDILANMGHLPVLVFDQWLWCDPAGRLLWEEDEWDMSYSYFKVFSRVKTCNLAVDYNEISSQSSSIISSSNSVSTIIEVKKYPQAPVSPPPTNVSLPIPISADIPLKSERGVDYTKLRDLLATEEWAKADEETNRIMLLIAGKEKIGYFDICDIKENFCEDFRKINQLWLKYSNDNFGFSVQKFIRDEVNEKLYEFLDRVGWDLDWGMGDKYRGNPHTFPKGHFPGRWFFGWYAYQGEDLGMARKPATEDMLWLNLDCF